MERDRKKGRNIQRGREREKEGPEESAERNIEKDGVKRDRETERESVPTLSFLRVEGLDPPGLEGLRPSGGAAGRDGGSNISHVVLLPLRGDFHH